MRIEIFEEDQRLIEDVRGTRSFYSQIGYLHKADSKYPVRFKIPMRGDVLPHQPGTYEISDSSFRVNNFEKLELDPYNLTLVESTEVKAKRAR